MTGLFKHFIPKEEIRATEFQAQTAFAVGERRTFAGSNPPLIDWRANAAEAEKAPALGRSPQLSPEWRSIARRTAARINSGRACRATGMKKAKMALLIAGLGMGPASAYAAETTGWLPVVLPQTEQRDIHSHHTGHDFRIFVSEPQKPPPPDGYPVIYVLDGNALFPLVALQANALETRPDSASRQSIVVVGVGYPGYALYDPARRARDYTPPPPTANAPAETDQQYGGADRLLAFIQTELKPLVEARYRINPHRQTLFGHSYGGLFTLYALISQPDAFQNYVAASPSIWWNHRQLLGQSDCLLASATRLEPTRLWLTVGGAEEPTTDTPPASAHERRRAERRMRSNLQAFSERLAPLDRHGLTRTLTTHPNADHGENGTLTAAGVLDFALRTEMSR